MDNKTKGICLALTAMIGSGIFAIPYRLSLERADPLTVVWGIFVCALMFSLPGAWISRKKMKYSLKIGLVTLAISLSGLIANYSVCRAVLQDSPTLFNLVSKSEILMAIILSWIFLKEFISIRVWISLIFVIVGILVMKLDSINFEIYYFYSSLWALLAAFGFALMAVLAKSIIHEIEPQVLNIFRLSIAIIVLFGFKEVRIDILNLNVEEWIYLSFAAFCGPFLGRISYTYSLRYLTISKSVIIGSFSPVITLILELLVFGSIISWIEALGGFILLSGIIWLFLPKIKK